MPNAAGYADLYDLPRPLRDALESELSSGERLLWADRPAVTRNLRESLPILFFGIPWTAFSVFWMVMASGILRQGSGGGAPTGVNILFALFGLPFVGIGLAMLSAPYFAWRAAQNTVYAITTKRVLILNAGRTRSVRAYLPQRAADLQRTERADGSGDLIFGPTGGGRHGGSGTSGPGGASLLPPMFTGIPNVRAVEELMRATFLNGREAAEAAPAYGVGALPAGHHVHVNGGVTVSPSSSSPWWTSGDR